jgi:GAF domain-containing protein
VGERPQKLDVLMPSPVSTSSADQSIEELKRELKEAHRRETATAEILRIISSSPTNMQAVFDMVAASAARLCDAHDATIHQVDAGLLRLVVHYGPILTGPTMPIVRGALIGRALLERRSIQVADLPAEKAEYPEGSDSARRLGFRTTLAVPLIRADEAIGVIAIRRTEVRPFTDRQIELLKTFADQAVIAIENARMFEEVQARTKELTESLQYQTATSDVLNVISRSPSNLQPVLDAIAATAMRLCQARRAVIWKLEGRKFHLVAYTATTDPEHARFLADNPVSVGQGSIAGRAAIQARTIHLHDASADPTLEDQKQRLAGGARTMLAVPLLRDGVPVGVIVLSRTEVHPFTEKQIDLVTTFANQAVIAIENTRLFEEVQATTRELTESLEHQTATSEVLGAISRTPDELQPVLDTIVDTARRLCSADRAYFNVLREGRYDLVASKGAPKSVIEDIKVKLIEPSRGSPAGRALLEKRVIHIEDARTDQEFTLFDVNDPDRARTMLSVPLLRGDDVVGVITVARVVAAPFTQRQINLVTTFANQAVIAINNVGLCEEVQARTRHLAESLQQQTATADVLKVISRSAFDLQAVLDALVESAAKLCGGEKSLRVEHLPAEVALQ